MSSSAQLIDRIEQVLADTANAIWSTAWIEEGLRQALSEYSTVRPRQQVTTLAVASAARELDISSMTCSGVISVSAFANAR